MMNIPPMTQESGSVRIRRVEARRVAAMEAVGHWAAAPEPTDRTRLKVCAVEDRQTRISTLRRVEQTHQPHLCIVLGVGFKISVSLLGNKQRLFHKLASVRLPAPCLASEAVVAHPKRSMSVAVQLQGSA
eukprot:1790142-Rhodomonas_salina.1